MKKKIKITDIPYMYIDNETFTGELGEVANRILAIRENMKASYDERSRMYTGEYTPFEQYEDIVIQREFGYDYDSYRIAVYRNETDEEYQVRIDREERYKKLKKLTAQKGAETRRKKKEEEERKLYETLKKKYENA
jgi:hypothetical protein